MLQTLLARDNLMCGYGTGLDPSVDLKHSGQTGTGSRPTIFFGPERDALSLITKQVGSLILLRPKKLKDFDTKLYILSFAANNDQVSDVWKEAHAKYSGQIFPKGKWLELEARESHLQPDADVYKQTFHIANATANTWEAKAKVSIGGLIWDNALQEDIHLEGCEDFDCWFLHWHKPEIGAAHLLQATHVDEQAGNLTSYKGDTFFTVSASQDLRPCPLAFGEAGWNQQKHFAYNRFGDILHALISRDDILGFHYSANVKDPQTWLPLDSHATEAIGQTDGLAVWSINPKQTFSISYKLNRHIDEARKPYVTDFELSKKNVIAADISWLKEKKPAPDYLSEKAKNIYTRTLLTLKQMQDPGGGIIAAPEFHYNFTHCGGYGYCWGRDAGFISYAMDVGGLHKESADFYRYMSRCQSEDGSFLHRHDMSGNLGASWGLLQPDETGSVVYGIWQHVDLSKNSELAIELKDTIVKACDWLASSKHPFDPDLPIPGHDLWEERVGVHYYAVASMAAGIDAGIKISQLVGWETPQSWLDSRDSLVKLMHSERFIGSDSKGQAIFARSILRNIDHKTKQVLESRGASTVTQNSPAGRPLHYLDQDYVVDISQLGAGYPYDMFDFSSKGDEWDQLIEQVNEQLWRPGAGGVGRYESDYYRDGNPWMLATVWLGLAAQQRGKTEIAKKCWQWTLDHCSPEGLLSEQIDPKTGKPSWVMPLTWSHAMYALAVHQFSREVTQ